MKSLFIVLTSYARLVLRKLLLGGRLTFHPLQSHSLLFRLHVGRMASLKLGRNTQIAYGVDFHLGDGAAVAIGNGVYFGPRCMLSAHKSIDIGDGCLFGPDVKVFDNNHVFARGLGVLRGEHRSDPIAIGRNCWIGANAVILKGVTIGDGCVIGAGCVIRKSLPEYTISTMSDSVRTVPILDAAAR